jgi:hypothetical protein
MSRKNLPKCYVARTLNVRENSPPNSRYGLEVGKNLICRLPKEIGDEISVLIALDFRTSLKKFGLVRNILLILKILSVTLFLDFAAAILTLQCYGKPSMILKSLSKSQQIQVYFWWIFTHIQLEIDTENRAMTKAGNSEKVSVRFFRIISNFFK